MKASEFLESLSTLTREDLLSIKGIGSVLADNVLEFINSERFHTLLTSFEDLEEKGKGLTISSSSTTNNGPLINQTIVITGTFDISRSDIQKKLESLGAKVANSVTKSTTLLLAGDDAGSKLETAHKLNIPISDNLSILNT